jgi:hypothetical protein
MAADQIINAYDYNSLVLLYIKTGDEKNPNALLSGDDIVAEDNI